MASNVSQNKVPSVWSSAAQNITFEFSFNPLLMNGIGSDAGKAFITLFNVFDVTPTIGEYIYIVSPSYTGTYKIIEVTGTNIVTLDTPYITTITVDTYYCYHLRVPLFTLNKGYLPGELYALELPYTKVIDIKPSVLYDAVTGLPYLSINIKGVTKYLFTITENVTANAVEFSMFNAVRLIWDGLSTASNPLYDYNLVLNSTISNEALIKDYITGAKYLTPIDKPLIATKGTTFVVVFSEVVVTMVLVAFYPTLHKYINGVKQ